MAKIIGLPDGSEAEFPDNMSDDDIGTVLQKQFPSPVKTPDAPALGTTAPEPTGWSNLGRQLGLSARAGANVVASPVITGGRLLNKTINAMGGNVNPDLQGTLDKGLNALGLPEPRTDRPIEQAGQMMAQSAPAVALPGSLLPQALGNAALSSVQSPVGQELEEATIGGATGAIGQGLSRLAGGVITPSARALELLRSGAKNLTPGQMQGGLLRRTEEALAQTPFIGRPMRDRIAESRTGWEQSVKDAVAPPKSAPGSSDSIAALQESFTKAYNDSVNMAKFKPGTQPVKLTDDLVMSAKNRVPGATGEQMDKAAKLVDNLMENGGNPHTPASLQQVESSLKTLARKFEYSPDPEQSIYGDLLGNIASDMRSQWRNSLTGTKKAELASIDAQYRKFIPVQSASGKGTASLAGEEVPGSFSPQSLLRELRSGEKGSRKAQWFAGERPMQDSATAAENVIGSSTPSPSSMSRLAGLATLAGSVSGLGIVPTASVLGAAGLYGTKPVQRVLTSKFATGGSKYQKQLADAIRRFSPTVAAEFNQE